MKCTIENNELVIRIPHNDLKKLPTSKSGKTRIVASSNGNVNTGLKVQGSDLIVGLDAYIK